MKKSRKTLKLKSIRSGKPYENRMTEAMRKAPTSFPKKFRRHSND